MISAFNKRTFQSKYINPSTDIVKIMDALAKRRNTTINPFLSLRSNVNTLQHSRRGKQSIGKPPRTHFVEISNPLLLPNPSPTKSLGYLPTSGKVPILHNAYPHTYFLYFSQQALHESCTISNRAKAVQFSSNLFTSSCNPLLPPKT